MIKLLAGPKGSGKTQKMMDCANSFVKTCDGNVFFIMKHHRDTRGLSFNIRAICMDDYEDITNSDQFLGFIYGMTSADHDIEKIYIDGLLQQANISAEEVPAFVAKLEKISADFNTDFCVSVSGTKESLGVAETDTVVFC